MNENVKIDYTQERVIYEIVVYEKALQ